MEVAQTHSGQFGHNKPARLLRIRRSIERHYCEQILGIYELVEDELPLLTTLCYLKHYETQYKLKEMFQVS